MKILENVRQQDITRDVFVQCARDRININLNVFAATTMHYFLRKITRQKKVLKEPKSGREIKCLGKKAIKFRNCVNLHQTIYTETLFSCGKICI